MPKDGSVRDDYDYNVRAHIARIKLDFHLRENAIKEMQDAIDSAGKLKYFKTPNHVAGLRRT